MAFAGQAVALGTVEVAVYTCPSTIESSVHGLIIGNNTASAVTFTLKLYDYSAGTTTTIATNVSVAGNSAYTWPKPIDLNTGDMVKMTASSNSALVALVSAYENQSLPVAVGFTPRGTWSSVANYVQNDIVTSGGNSYIAVTSSLNLTPASNPAAWQILAPVSTAGVSSVNSLTGAVTITPATIGLGNVDNTSDATKNAAAVSLTNKTLVMPVVTGYTETVYSLSGTDINPANGTVQTKTLAGNTTFTESINDGQSVVLMINPATYSITWPTTSWISAAGTNTAPSLKVSVMNTIVLWQVGGVLYGSWIGSL